MEIIIEFLREGGLRLPSKIGQTLSMVGGIIVGDAVVQSKIVSSSSLFIVGLTTISSFLINNYDMAVAVRLLRFPMLVITVFFGLFGLALGWYLLILYLCSLKNFGVPYFSFRNSDMKDALVRAPLWKMNKRPAGIPGKDHTRQTDFRKENKKGSNEE
jgi:hypothetical protein